MRAVGTFGLAKKDVSRENKKKHRTKKKRDLLAGRERGEEEEEEEGKAYGGHRPAKGSR